MGVLDQRFEKNFMITSVDYVFNWARKSALWPLTFGLACCAIEMIASTTDRKSTRLNSSHGYISYAVFCLKKKNNRRHERASHGAVAGAGQLPNCLSTAVPRRVAPGPNEPLRCKLFAMPIVETVARTCLAH